MTLLLPVARPSKPPTVEVLPEADDYSAGLEALRIAELAGLELDDWQQWVLVHALALKGGLWAAFEVALIISRQTGKSEVLIAVILWALYTEVADPRLVIFAAHEYKTAREIFLRLRFLLDPPEGADPLQHADPMLLARVGSVRTANGEESIEVGSRRVRFLARTSGSGRGFTGDIVLLDEAYKLNQEQMAALLPTMGARPNPQIWYASMGPFENSDVQLSVMERARSDDPGSLAYFGYEAPEGSKVDDRDVWVQCNPAHPHRMSMQTLENEYRALGHEGFAREKLCMRVSSVERVIPADKWMQVQSDIAAPNPDNGALRFAVDLDETRGNYAVVVFDGEVAELIEHGPRMKLVERIVELAERYEAGFGLDVSGPAKSLVDELEEAGVTLEKFSGSDLAAACGRLYDGIVDGTFTIRTAPGFNTAVVGAARKQVDDAWRWSRSKSTEDISPLVALTVAVAMEGDVDMQFMIV